MQTSIDQQLIQELKAGSRHAFKKVFDAHYRSLVITAYQILKDEQVSKDAVQEVFVELWKKRARLHNGIVLLPYLKRSVMNRAINVLKSRKHHISSGSAPLEYLKDNNRQPDESLQDEEFKSVVLRAIDQLPDRCRAIFMLCRMEGLSHKEIAQRLDISTKTIENQITKALKLIRKEIAVYQGYTTVFFLFFFSTEWGFYLFDLFRIYLG